MPTEAKKILIVEDEKDLREAMATALSYEGFTVVTAADGEEGLTRAVAEKPDLIFLDLMMPNLDGIGMLKRLRDDEWGKEARVVILTVLDDMEKMAEAVELGAGEYIMKTEVSLSGIIAKAKEKLGM